MEVYRLNRNRKSWDVSPGPVWGRKYSLTDALGKWFKNRPRHKFKGKFWLVFTAAEEKRLQKTVQKLKAIGSLKESSLRNEAGLLQTFIRPPAFVMLLPVDSPTISLESVCRLAIQFDPSQRVIVTL